MCSQTAVGTKDEQMTSRGHTSLNVFVYGTLKRGQRNHVYCHGARFVRDATVRGRLYDLPSGYPALVVPHEDVRAAGTADPQRDVREAQGLNHQPQEMKGPEVFGELYTFDDAARLRALDRLEGFEPGNPFGPYRRVLLPARAADAGIVLAWVYVAGEACGTHLPAGRWPA